jgi:acyl-CoA thioesterase I
MTSLSGGDGAACGAAAGTQIGRRMTSDDLPTRRMVVAAGTAAATAPAAVLAAPEPRVALLGDSITAGYGLPARDALPARLQAELERRGVRARIVAAGVSGDTTAGGLARIDRAVPAGTALCVVALGGNDLLRGASPAAVRQNLERIVGRLKSRGVAVVLAGLQVPPLLAPDYARQFNQAFAAVGRQPGVLFLPDLLGGVLLNPDLNQPDGIHPNARGVQVIAGRLAPLVARGLKAG